MSNIIYFCVMKTNLIYGLRDPRNDVYKYIGKTTIGHERPLQHLLKSHNQLVNEWVKELSKLGTAPYVDIIEEDILLNQLAEKEKYYITYYSELYGELFNGGEHIKECISKPSILDYKHIDNALLTLLNPGEVFKMLKISTGFSHETIGHMLNVSRKTAYRLKEGETNITLDTVIRMIFFVKNDIQELFKFYMDNSNEFLGDYPDTFEQFITRCNCDEKFIKTWCDKFYRNKAFINKIVYNKRAKKRLTKAL
jgi:DNA-binding XRE family transcriptional regulator